jgi:hypothetical protein
MSGLFSMALFASIVESKFAANAMVAALLVWLFLVFKTGRF